MIATSPSRLRSSAPWITWSLMWCPGPSRAGRAAPLPHVRPLRPRGGSSAWPSADRTRDVDDPAAGASARGRAAARTPRARRSRGAPSGCPWPARSARGARARTRAGRPSLSRRLLAVAPQRDLDRALHGLRRVLDSIQAEMPRSAARATNSTSPSRVCAITGPGRVLDGLLDQRERVLVVLWTTTIARSGSSVAISSAASGRRPRTASPRGRAPRARRPRSRSARGPRRRSAREVRPVLERSWPRDLQAAAVDW